jgi:hypothetical protein
MTSDHPEWLPKTPEGLADWMNQLKLDPDQQLAPDEIPPVLHEDEDVLVPRSFKLPVQLDTQLAKLAAARGITKSDLVRRYLEQAVAAELLADGNPEVMIPLADALRALAGLRQLRRSA